MNKRSNFIKSSQQSARFKWLPDVMRKAWQSVKNKFVPKLPEEPDPAYYKIEYRNPEKERISDIERSWLWGDRQPTGPLFQSLSSQVKPSEPQAAFRKYWLRQLLTAPADVDSPRVFHKQQLATFLNAVRKRLYGPWYPEQVNPKPLTGAELQLIIRTFPRSEGFVIREIYDDLRSKSIRPNELIELSPTYETWLFSPRDYNEFLRRVKQLEDILEGRPVPAADVIKFFGPRPLTNPLFVVTRTKDTEKLYYPWLIAEGGPDASERYGRFLDYLLGELLQHVAFSSSIQMARRWPEIHNYITNYVREKLLGQQNDTGDATKSLSEEEKKQLYQELINILNKNQQTPSNK